MSILIRNCKLLTLDHKYRIFESGDIFIDGERINAVGENLLMDGVIPDQVIDGHNKLAVPGLINADLHASDLAFRGMYENLPLGMYIKRVLTPGGFLSFSANQLYHLALLAGSLSLKFGITSIIYHLVISSEDVQEKLNAVMQAFQLLGLRTTIALEIRDNKILDTYSELNGSPSKKNQVQNKKQESDSFDFEINQKYIDAIEKWRNLDLYKINLAIAPPFEMVLDQFSAAWLSRIVDRYNIPLHLHTNTTKSSTITARQNSSGLSFPQAAQQNGLLNQRTSLVDVIWVDQKDVALIAESKARVIHNPVSDLFLGNGVFPMNSFSEANIPIGLGTGIATGGNLNLFDVIKTAASLQRVVQPNFSRWPKVDQILSMVTYQAAGSSLLEDKIGRIETGYYADLVLFDTNNYSFTPLNNIVDQLVCLETGDSVDTVIVGGQLVFEKGSPKNLDRASLTISVNEVTNQNEVMYEYLEDLQAQHDFLFERDHMYNAQKPFEFTRWANAPTVASRLEKASYQERKS